METKHVHKSQDLLGDTHQDVVFILTSWQEAATNLYQHHNRLLRYAYQACVLNKPVRPIGQCSIRQLKTILRTIEVELARLIREMNQPDRSAKLAINGNYTTLVNHTRRLNHLNQQAQTTLYLLELNAS